MSRWRIVLYGIGLAGINYVSAVVTSNGAFVIGTLLGMIFIVVGAACGIKSGEVNEEHRKKWLIAFTLWSFLVTIAEMGLTEPYLRNKVGAYFFSSLLVCIPYYLLAIPDAKREELAWQEQKAREEEEQRNREFVADHSPILSDLMKLFSKSEVYKLPNGERYVIECNSKAEFDRITGQTLLQRRDIDWELDLVNVSYWLTSNIDLESEVIKTIEKAVAKKEHKDLLEEHEFFKEIEDQMVSDLTRSRFPEGSTKLKMYVDVNYESPGGRKSYHKSFELTEKAVLFWDRREKERLEWRMQAANQRNLMTQKLRYQILKRDNFTCVLCGASVKTGARLHVDHIIPVSKGGLTIPSNLRTLCEDCNWGKGDSYDPDDLN